MQVLYVGINTKETLNLLWFELYLKFINCEWRVNKQVKYNHFYYNKLLLISNLGHFNTCLFDKEHVS
jgi:hypothetical protein